MARGAAPVGNVEALVEPRQGVGKDDDELDEVVEAVEAGLGMEPPGVVCGNAIIRHACTEGRAEREQTGREDDEEELVAHAAAAKLFDALAAGDDEAEANDDGRQKGQEGKVGHGHGLGNVRLVDGRLVQRVDAVDDADDEHEETADDRADEAAKDDPGGHAPAKMRVVGPQDALDEDQIGHEEGDDTRVGEDLGGDGDARVARVLCPDDAHDVGGDARHGEAEEEAGQDELVAAPLVALEDGHVEDGRGDEEGEDDGGDGDVDLGGGREAEGGVFGGVGGALGMNMLVDDDGDEDAWC